MYLYSNMFLSICNSIKSKIDWIHIWSSGDNNQRERTAERGTEFLVVGGSSEYKISKYVITSDRLGGQIDLNSEVFCVFFWRCVQTHRLSISSSSSFEYIDTDSFAPGCRQIVRIPIRASKKRNKQIE